jgi:hypothetical protein
MAADEVNREAMGHFGKITSIKDLPAKKVLTAYIKQAMKLNDDGVPRRRAPSRPRRGRWKSPTI